MQSLASTMQPPQAGAGPGRSGSRGLFPLRNPAQPAWVLVAAISLWIAGPANWPLWAAWAALPEASGPAAALQGLALLGLVAGLTGLLPLALPRVLLKPALGLLLLATALVTHFQGSYGVVIDADMARNARQTDWREVRDLLSPLLLLNLAWIAALPGLVLAWVPLRPAGPWRRALRARALALAAWLAALLAVLILAYGQLAGLLREHKALRYQVAPLNAAWALAADGLRSPRHRGPPSPIALDVQQQPAPPGAKPPLILLVLGETARADRLALNGYPRPTTPALEARGAISLGRVQACGTSTAASLPCMFSPWGREGHLQRDARGERTENVLDAMQRAGLSVLWVDNQSGCKGLCDRIPQARAETPAPGAGPLPAGLCPGGACHDEVLVEGLDARLAALDPARRARGTVIVLHLMGNHGPAYHARSPAHRKPFQPECRRTTLADCRQAELDNAYDNAIAYTDHVLGRAVDWLQAQAAAHDVALLYLSDHGESLGEHGVYLHGLPYALAPAAQTEVPGVMWLGPAWRSRLPGHGACLQPGPQAAPLRHDLLFHTLYGLTRLRSAEYRPALDRMQACRPQA